MIDLVSEIAKLAMGLVLACVVAGTVGAVVYVAYVFVTMVTG